MFRDGGLGERQTAHDIAAMTGIALRERRKDAQADRMRERAKALRQAFLMPVLIPVLAGVGFVCRNGGEIHRPSTIGDDAGYGKGRGSARGLHGIAMRY